MEYNSWDEWDPKSYLNTYFKKVNKDSTATWKFFIEEIRKLDVNHKKVALDFGSGPTIFGALPLTDYIEEIHLSDYLQVNLDEVDKWLRRDIDCFDWEYAIAESLRIEGENLDLKEQVKLRQEKLRLSIKKLIRCDASKNYPLIGVNKVQYPLVITSFCAESATHNKIVWEKYMENIFNLIEPGGVILLSALRKCKYYKNGTHYFPSANIDENDLHQVLTKNSFTQNKLRIVVKDTPECENDGFSSIILAKAQKST